MKWLAFFILLPWTLPCLVAGFLFASVVGMFKAGIQLWNRLW